MTEPVKRKWRYSSCTAKQTGDNGPRKLNGTGCPLHPSITETTVLWTGTEIIPHADELPR
jgi:hypothetical protein